MCGNEMLQENELVSIIHANQSRNIAWYFHTRKTGLFVGAAITWAEENAEIQADVGDVRKWMAWIDGKGCQDRKHTIDKETFESLSFVR